MSVVNDGVDLITKSVKMVDQGYDMAVKMEQKVIKSRTISQVFSFFSIVSIGQLKQRLTEMKKKKKYKNIKNCDNINKFEELVEKNEKYFTHCLQLEVGYKVGLNGKYTRTYKYIFGFIQHSKDISIYLNENGIIENLKTYTTILKDRITDTYVRGCFVGFGSKWTSKKIIEMKCYIEEIVVNQIFFIMKTLNPFDQSLFSLTSRANKIKINKNSKLQKDLILLQMIELKSGIRFNKIFNVLLNQLEILQQGSDKSFNLQYLMNNLHDNNNNTTLTTNNNQLIINNIKPVLPNIYLKNGANEIDIKINSPDQADKVTLQKQQQQQQQQQSSNSISINDINNNNNNNNEIDKNNNDDNKNNNISSGGNNNYYYYYDSNRVNNDNNSNTANAILKLKQTSYQPNIIIISRPFKISKLNNIQFLEKDEIKMKGCQMGDIENGVNNIDSEDDDSYDDSEDEDIKGNDKLISPSSFTKQSASSSSSSSKSNKEKDSIIKQPQDQHVINSPTKSLLIKKFLLKYSLLAKSMDDFILGKGVLNLQVTLINELNEILNNQIDYKSLFNGCTNIEGLFDDGMVESLSNPIIDSLKTMVPIYGKDQESNKFNESIQQVIKINLQTQFNKIKLESDPLAVTSTKLLVQLSIITNVLPIIKEFSKYLIYLIKKINHSKEIKK